ncbi:MAG: hypothetical protein KKF62_13135 [Bacteroidetes bacterium]|nr:hypothetical protein [Bacteroidota bacterium]MBU1114900.1 hypothetical protein [Bacteroidota bacterium]MBU1799390.1 hypothetical protein [Bacteroidota bacterium]
MNINFGDLLSILSITVFINIGLFAVFYSTLYKRAHKLVKYDKEIAQNKMILIKTLDQQTICLEQLFVKINDVENMLERLANYLGQDKREQIIKFRKIILPKNFLLLKNISELKLFGEDEQYRLSAFKNLVSVGDIKTLDLINLKIKTEQNSNYKSIYKSYKKGLENRINSIISDN